MTRFLGDVCAAVVDCEHKTAPVGDGFALSVGTRAMKDGRLAIDACKPVSEATYRAWTRRMRPQPGDLILAREAPVGQVVRVPQGAPVCLGQRTVLIRPDPSKVHPRFLHYWLLGPDAQRRMASQAGGATVAHLNVEDIRALDVSTLPSSPLVQSFAAEVLGSIDDLIENNRRRIELLEQMVQAIYRRWFVFLRYPGHEGSPNIDTAYNITTQGWTRERLGARFKIVLGGTPSRSNPAYWTNGTVPWINSGRVNDLRVISYSELITEAALRYSNATLMPRGTTIIAITGATLGQVSMLEIDACANQSVVGVVDPAGRLPELIYLVVSNQIESLIGHASGGAQQHINKTVVEAAEFLLPPETITDDFTARVRPMFALLADLLRANLTLSRTRNLLLPKLVTDQIDVSNLDLDAFLEGRP